MEEQRTQRHRKKRQVLLPGRILASSYAATCKQNLASVLGNGAASAMEACGAGWVTRREFRLQCNIRGIVLYTQNSQKGVCGRPACDARLGSRAAQVGQICAGNHCTEIDFCERTG